MPLFRKRNLTVGVGTFIIGIVTCAAIWGVPQFLRRGVTVKSQAAAYLLDDRGAVNGLLLTSGDQLRFGPRAGEAVAAQIKVGDEVAATGRAGSKTSYGREIRVERIAANGRTIVLAESGPRPRHEPPDRRGPKGPADRPSPPVAPAPSGDAVVGNTAEAPPETFKAAGTIKAHLVNGRGDVDGLLLSGGEQVRFSPEVGKLVVSAEHGADTLVSVEGAGVRGQSGLVLRPALLTVGDQTVALGR